MDIDEWCAVAAAAYRRLSAENGIPDDVVPELVTAVMREYGRDYRTRDTNKAAQGWEQEPASTDQLNFLDEIGVDYPDDITKGEASDLIDDYTG